MSKGIFLVPKSGVGEYRGKVHWKNALFDAGTRKGQIGFLFFESLYSCGCEIRVMSFGNFV